MSLSPSTDEANPISPQLRNPADPVSVPRSALFLQPETPKPAAPPTPPSPNSPSPSFSKDSPNPDRIDVPAAANWSPDSGGADSGSPRRESSGAPSTGDLGDKPAAPITRGALRTVLSEAVITGTGMLSTIAARGPEADAGLWRADDDDAAAISGPASRMIWRRVPADARDNDTIDLISLAFAIGAYAMKNWRLKTLIRQHVAAGMLPADPTAASEGV